MELLILIVKSKNLKSLYYISDFICFFIKKFKTFVFNKQNNQFNKKNFSILKSPHVHKTAQEQFKQVSYKKNYLVLCLNSTKFKIIFTLKKLVTNFYDINLNFNLFLFKLKFYSNFLGLNNFYFILANKNYSNNFYNKNFNFYYLKKFKIFNFIKLLNFLGIFLK